MYENGNPRRDVGITPYSQISLRGNNPSDWSESDIKILASYHAHNRSVIGPVVGVLGMIAALVCVFNMFFGFMTSDTFSGWGIKAVVSFVILALLSPIILRISQWVDHKNYQYWLYVSNDFLGCIMAPKHYRHTVNVMEFMQSQPEGQTTEELWRAMKLAEAEAVAKSQRDFENGLTTYLISRHFRIYTSSKHIELTDGERQLYLPYDSGALEFLKDVALISDVAPTYKVDETNQHTSNFKELQAVLIGFAFGYAFQLFGMFLAWAGGGDFIFTMKEVFMPSPYIVGIPALFMTWIAFAMVRVRWMRLWSKISVVVFLGFGFPFAMISAGVIFIMPALIHTSAFWFVTIAISALFTIACGVPLSRQVA